MLEQGHLPTVASGHELTLTGSFLQLGHPQAFYLQET